MKRTLLSLLVIFFAQTTYSQSITVTAPNGGEQLYGCKTYTIKWNAVSTSGYYDIDYSLNNGAIWASIASNINILTGQYTWTVPNVESSNCLVRVRDKNNVTVEDISNAVFSIHIPVTITAPNGGENWAGNSVHAITWNAQGTSTSYNIDYSINGGSTWISIAAGLSNTTGTYNWTVPNNPSTQCIVRVLDAITNCMQDVSNSNFTITAVQPLVTSFNTAGSVLSWEYSPTITWDASTFYSPVKLEYSLDNGATWVVITSSTANDGSQIWTGVPKANSTTCLIKASNTADLNSFDICNANFSILAPTVTITAPNGGETWYGCETHAIGITVKNSPNGLYNNSFYLLYSTNAGASWTQIGSILATSALTYSYNWAIPNTINSTQCLLRVYTSTYSNMVDTSNAMFNILPSNAITVTSPNGGELLPAFSSKTITWTNTVGGTSGLYNVSYFNGTSTVRLASNITGNSYNWTNIPNVPSANCYVTVTDTNNLCKSDQSNATFTVTPAQPLLTSFNTPGSVVSWEYSPTITWDATTFYSPVKLEYSLDNGASWILITASTPNDGSQSWTNVPNANSTTCLIKASNTADLNSFDICNANFSILAPTVTITSPNGGETWATCETHAIGITVKNSPNGLYNNSYYLLYSTDAGANWTQIGSILATSALTYSYNWTIPNTINSSQCLLRVYTSTYAVMKDTSNAVFNIVPNNAITVTSPNGGETLTALTSKTITWTNTAAASGVYNIYYYNGTTTTTLASNVTGNSYNWTNIPNVPGSNYYVTVTDANNTCRSDRSDATFSVGTVQPLLTSLNGGEVVPWEYSPTLTWDASTFNSPLQLEYSINNGQSWILITASTPNDGSYSWTTVPSINSTSCLIRASNTSDLNSFDISNATFSILAPTVTITSPNGGETWATCETHAIGITVKNSPNGLYNNSFYLLYSTDAGANWTQIGSTLATSALTYSYNWTIPNTINSSQCLLRVYTSTYAVMKDTSNAAFSIVPNNAITVTSPNGSETLTALSSKTITWTNTAAASGVYNISYFNGTTTTTLASSVTGNSYTWTNIPNVPGSNYYVTVTDANNTCKYDRSDATFSVGTVQPLLTSLNGGEVVPWEYSPTLTWDASTFNSPLQLEYSINNGQSWILITSSTPNDGSYIWSSVPSINSTTCLIRASNTSDLASFDISNATFSILAPTVTITSPNGGETWATCETHAIGITVKNSPNGLYNNSFYLLYSTDAGANWTQIGSILATSALTYSYNWTIPNTINSSQCLLRVYTSTYAVMKDTSNAVFSIVPNNAITVTSPNGGETLTALTSKTITWTNTAAASGVYNISYYNGTTTTTLASNVTGNSYNWTNIPNVPGSNYYVTVTDANNTCRSDRSDATFSVGTVQPLLTSLNGGEVVPWEYSPTLTWDAATFNSPLQLEYSINNGQSWILITSSTPNDGSYIWSSVPSIYSTTCLIRASNSSDLASFDISNATFSILAPTVTITSPNGGETWANCETHAIGITVKNSPNGLYNNSFYLLYSTDAGANWTQIGSILATSALTYSYNWTIPNTINSSQCLLRVYTSTYAVMKDTSNAVFNIVPNNAITVTSPNGGESLPALSGKTITWTNTAAASGLYNVSYFNGSSIVRIASGIVGNSYNWTNIPNIPSANCYVIISDSNNTCRSDQSNANFTVTAAQPILTYPNGGETLWPGINSNITWNSATFYSPVKLEYSLNNGQSWIVITASTPNDGSQNWTIPNTSSTTCLIRASNTADLNSNDVSNAVFVINPAVTILTPNGGDELGACTQTSITFNHSTAYTLFSFDYSLNNGNNWTTIAANQTFNTSNSTFNWSIPNLPTIGALVRVYPTNDISLADQSNATFTIKPSVSIIQPNFGGTLVAGSVFPIKWASDGISNFYDIAYSTAGTSGPWTNIVLAYNTAAGVYNWTVPAISSTNVYISIIDNVNTCKQDISDLPFTIAATAQPIKVTSSNGLDTIQGCKNYAIQWTETAAPIGTYNIDLSTNGGSSWTSIAANYATTTGTYNWLVPNINTSLGLIRVSAANNSAIFDASDAAFTIKGTTLGADTVVLATCSNCTINIAALYNTNEYTLVNWSTPTPTIATPGKYQLVANTSNGCSDTAVVSVNVEEAGNIRICAGGNASFAAGISGASYQWQVNTGIGFTNISNNLVYSGANSATLQLSNIPSTYYGYTYRCLIDGLNYSNTSTIKITDYWTGAVSTAWEDSANWACGIVPDSNTDILVYGGKTNTLTINSVVTCRSVYAAPGAIITVSPGSSLKLLGQ